MTFKLAFKNIRFLQKWHQIKPEIPTFTGYVPNYKFLNHLRGKTLYNSKRVWLIPKMSTWKHSGDGSHLTRRHKLKWPPFFRPTHTLMFANTNQTTESHLFIEQQKNHCFSFAIKSNGCYSLKSPVVMKIRSFESFSRKIQGVLVENFFLQKVNIFRKLFLIV